MTQAWIQKYRDQGLRPYVATAAHQVGALNLEAAGQDVLVFALEDPAAKSFHEAYVTANALAFGSRDLKMPGWVYIDCVLMQSAVVGFAAPRAAAPEALAAEFGGTDEGGPDWLPVSGQIASPALDGQTLVGFSLFSLRSYWPQLPVLGLVTKGMALEVYRAREYERFLGITQYDNPALAMHGCFGNAVEIVAAGVPLHSQGIRSLVYGMKIDFELERLHEPKDVSRAPDFWVTAGNPSDMERLGQGIAEGKRYFILPPFQVREGQAVKLPIAEETGS
jgi:hypothetical protein